MAAEQKRQLEKESRSLEAQVCATPVLSLDERPCGLGSVCLRLEPYAPDA